MATVHPPEFRGRAFCALGNALLLPILAATGLILHCTRGAATVRWIHFHAALAFLCCAVPHALYNLRALRHYNRTRRGEPGEVRREWWAALATALSTVLLALRRGRRRR